MNWLPFGADSGFSTEGDALVNVSADGVDLNLIWGEVQAAVSAWNAERSSLTSLLSFSTTNTADAIPQSTSAEGSFELATEFGEPESLRAPSKHLLLGYTFEDYDKATRWTWKFLRNATAEQVRAQANYALEADNRLVNGTILQQLFDSTPDVNEWGHTVYPLYNSDAVVPPDYLGRTFTAPHNHYLISGNATVDSGDVEDLLKLVTEHGFNEQLLLLVNPQEGEVISSFRAGITNNNSAIARHDFIPSQGSPAYLTVDNIVGTVAPATYNGLKVNGSYGPLWMIESDYVPAGYMTVVSTYGPNNVGNVIGFRQHVQAAYQGLRVIAGGVPAYPIQDAFFSRSFGVGVRRRGQAAVMEIKATGSYETPNVPK